MLLSPVHGGPPEGTAEAEAAVLAQDTEVLRQQPGDSGVVRRGLHRTDRSDDLAVPLAGVLRRLTDGFGVSGPGVSGCSLGSWPVVSRVGGLGSPAGSVAHRRVCSYRGAKNSPSAVASTSGASSAMWWAESMLWPRTSSAQSRQIASGSP